MSLREGHGVESLRQDRRESVDAVEELLVLVGPLILLTEILEFPTQRLHSVTDPLRSLLELLLVDVAALIRIEQASAFVTNAIQLLLNVRDLPREE